SSATGPNGDTATIGFDIAARPASSVSPFGAGTSIAYSYNPPITTATTNISATVNNNTTNTSRYTRTTLDGLGRPDRLEQGDGHGAQAWQDTVYDSCACSPLGKMVRTSQPYAPGGTAHWTQYTYDGLGRTLTMVAADGASTTTYSYQGNTTTIT